MKKFTSLLSMLLVLCLLLSMTVFAEDNTEWIDNPGADKILVDTEQNTVTFIYDETDTELMEQWEALPSFTDVPEDFEYQMYISYLSQRGVMNGTTETTFSPNQAITRIDFARTIALAENTDVSQTDAGSSTGDMASTANQNLMSLEDPNGTVTHAEAVEILSQLVQDHAQQDINSTDSVFATAICQKKIADTLSLTGLLDEETGAVIDADDAITRAETAQMLSGFLFERDKPTLITGTTPLTYLGAAEAALASLSETSIDDDESFHAELAGFTPEDGIISPYWTSTNTEEGGEEAIGNSVHKMLTNQGFYILFSDKGSTVSNIRGKYSQDALANIYYGSRAPDIDETDIETNPKTGKETKTYKGHYGSPRVISGQSRIVNKNGETNPTAYTRFNDHYYEAKVAFSHREWTKAYNELGQAIHYLEDINCPPHAALITNENENRHTNYEVWVRDNFYSSYWESTASSNTYSYMCNSTFFTISYDFATLAKNVAGSTVNDLSRGSTCIANTRECLKRTQRAIAGLGYRFLVDTGRAN
ncbi:MAG: S-layer homology domain-containing protein [Oscillospiraceae bacterium]|jgi:hypothetical protein